MALFVRLQSLREDLIEENRARERHIPATDVIIQSNYSFCVDWALRQQRHAKVLDYGCGAGAIVADLRAHGIKAFGCDTFYEGADASVQVPNEMFDQGVIRRMFTGAVPFESESFDLVINNTVLEHVENLESTLAELARVLKPGGKVLSLFPHREVWLEWHVGLPFIHRFDSGSRARLWYAMLLRAMGLGFFKADKSIGDWSRDAVDWVDRWTHYRPRVEVERAFGREFVELNRLEAQWLEHKFGRAQFILHTPARLKQFAVTLLAGLVFECKKPMVGSTILDPPIPVPL